MFKPKDKSKLYIPLCRMISLPIVRPHLGNDVMRLGSHFVNTGYMDGHGVFYVALEDNEGRTVPVTQDISDSWSPLWKSANEAFESELQKDDVLKQFSGQMFHVWDGNHRLQAWMPIINRDHSHDAKWHYAVESIILNVDGQVAPLLTALHQVNWYVHQLMSSYWFMIL